MNIFLWVLFGVAAGVVAHISDEREAAGGVLGAMMLGILGAVGGGIVATFLFGIPLVSVSFDLVSFIIAIVGSILLLLVHRTVFVKTYRE